MYRKRQTSIFAILHPAATTSRTAPEQPRTPLQSYAFRGGAGGALYFCLHPPMAAPRLLVVRIVSARVQLLCTREICTPRGVRTSFQRILAIFAWFFTVFSYFGMVFHRFQGVEKRFQSVSRCSNIFFRPSAPSSNTLSITRPR